MPDDIIPPHSPAEFVNYLLDCGDMAAARAWQAFQIMCGRACALEGGMYSYAAPAAWQRGYVEALQDMEQ